MTRHHTLHAPAAGIRLAWPSAITIVIDPGPDERARTRNLARERYLLAGAVLLSVAGIVVLQRSEPHDRPWTLATGLLLGALACAAVRSARRAVPAGLVDLLEPLRAVDPACPAEIHRLVWEAADLIGTAETHDDMPACLDCADRVEQIRARLRDLTCPGGSSGLRSSPARTAIERSPNSAPRISPRTGRSPNSPPNAPGTHLRSQSADPRATHERRARVCQF